MRELDVVRFRVMPGSEQKYIVARREVRGEPPGFRDVADLGVTDPVSGEMVAELPGGR